jgi:hypothetical protein
MCVWHSLSVCCFLCALKHLQHVVFWTVEVHYYCPDEGQWIT